MVQYNKDFLKQLDSHPHKELYIRIISLDKNDRPREQIEGQCTGGSINVDGASALRRSCQLTLVAEEGQPFTNTYWAFENKFKLEVGLKNNIDTKYPDIIWFKQGVYVITSFSKTENANGQIQISLSGQDKMCLLNGTIGGALPHEVDFGTEGEIQADGSEHIMKVPIYKIIKYAMQAFGRERIENIIINDLDQNGWELWDYRGDKPMYMFYQIPAEGEIYGKVINMTLNGNTEVNIIGEATPVLISDETIKYYSMNTLDSNYNEGATQILFKDNIKCYIIKIEYGETAGYHRTNLVYNDDLIAKAGDTITSVLDKIKNMLGDFEYFYDLDGRFVFQKKKTYIQELFSPINGEIIEPTMTVSPYSYKFEGKDLFTNISIPPKIDNVKNDFAIWGTRNGAGNAKLPIHARYAIDTKPTEYNSLVTRYTNLYFLSPEEIEFEEGMTKEEKFNLVKSKNGYIRAGWATEYTKPDQFSNEETYYILNPSNKGDPESDYVYIYKNQKYEVFYMTDMDDFMGHTLYNGNGDELVFDKGRLKYKNSNQYCDTIATLYEFKEKIYKVSDYDWRELIYQMASDYYQLSEKPDFFNKVAAANPWAVDGITGYEQYYADIQGFWRQLYNPTPTEEEQDNYYSEGEDKYWNKKIHTDPYSFNFWFDFLDVGEGAELSKYSVKKIGQRSKVDNQSSVNSIYNKETPEVQFIVLPVESSSDQQTSYSPIWIQDNMKSLFTRSSQGKSCIERANELIFTHSCCNESFSVTAIPIYYLEPNTRIQILGEDYTLDKITYNLNYNGTMNISGVKIMKQFY